MEENIYRKARKTAAKQKPLLNNCESAQDLVYIERTKLLAIESGDKTPSPDDVVSMARAYDAPELCNYYCTNECPIGMKYVPKARLSDFSQVTIDIIASLNALSEEKDRMIAIARDGRVNDFERRDFDEILEKLSELERSIQGMKIWIKYAASSGKLDDAL